MSTTPRGRLVALEGIDGCGKSTQAGLLADRLTATGVVVVRTREPGATRLGRALRALLLDPVDVAGGAEVSIRAEALLMAADRAQHVAEVVDPALATGLWVVTDRFAGSTLAYQGAGRGLDRAELSSIVGWATGGLVADVSVLVDVPVEVGRSRLHASGAPDRLERLGQDFHQRVRQGFVDQATADPERWLVVDGTAGVAAVAEAVFEGVMSRLGPLTAL